jgi:hypothetical protein
MFQILVREKKRRAISPLFLAVSAAAHVAIFGGVMYAASGEPERTEVVIDDIIDIPDVPEKAIEKPTVDPPPPAPDTPDEPAADAPVIGETLLLQPPTDIPPVISPPRANETPITPDMVTGIGKPGDVIGTPDPTDIRPATGNPDPGTPVKPQRAVPPHGAQLSAAAARCAGQRPRGGRGDR